MNRSSSFLSRTEKLEILLLLLFGLVGALSRDEISIRLRVHL